MKQGKFHCGEIGCDRSFDTAQGRAMHRTVAHGRRKGKIVVPSPERRYTLRDTIVKMEARRDQMTSDIDVLKRLENEEATKP